MFGVDSFFLITYSYRCVLPDSNFKAIVGMSQLSQ